MIKYVILSMILLGYFSVSGQTTSTKSEPKVKPKKSDYTITVTMLDGTSDLISSDIYEDDEVGKSVIYKNSCEAIYPDQTTGIVVKDNAGREYRGIPVNGTWYFVIYERKELSIYGENPGSNEIRKMHFKDEKGEYHSYSREYLRTKLATNSEANELLKKHFRKSTFQRSTFISAAILSTGGLISPTFLIPAVLTIVSALLYEKPKQNTLIEAIKSFNETK